MAVYKVFPIQDTTLYSSDKTSNTGLDEILEVGAYNYSNQIPASTTILGDLGVDDIRRSLVMFDSNDLRAAVSGVTVPVTSSLRMFLASADNLAQAYSIEAYAIAQSWQNGLGKYSDAPTNTGGASWTYRSSEALSLQWSTNNGAVTSSLFSRGGGSWRSDYSASQNFTFTSNKDVNINVSNIVDAWTGSVSLLQNNGFIIKLPNATELDVNSYTGLKFYSRETHTIYPPCIELKWDDSTFATGSNGYVTASKDSFVLTSTNNLGTFFHDAVHTFNFKTREQYPTRVFQTSSVYLEWQYLPTQSYWAIQDYKTKEMVIDFDTVGTKLSTTANGNSFTLYMNGLEPERSYKILIKTTLATGETVVKDHDTIFKVIR